MRCNASVFALLVFSNALSAFADDIDENFFLSTVRRAQSTPGVIAHSRSGQFVIARAPIVGVPPARNTSAAQPTLRYLVPELMAVSCERIRHQLLTELGVPDSTGHKILVVIQPLWPGSKQIDIAAKHFGDGWGYQISVPQQIDEEKVVRAIVQALVLELANRRSADRSCEVPLWFTEGLTQQLLATAEMEWVLQPELGGAQRVPNVDGNAVAVFRQNGTVHQGIKRGALFSAHRQLSANAPLSFAELSFPGPAQFESAGWQTYQSCAQLFVQRLLAPREGRARARTMLAVLPQCLNWQTAFLKAFASQFGSMRDVEKWWALMLVNFTGRDHWQAWPRAASLEKLNQALQFSAQLRTTNDLPARAAMTPQQVIATMDFVTQKTFLTRTITQLDALRPRLFAELAPLLDAYRETLDGFLQARGKSGFALDRRGQTSESVRLLARQTVRKLDALDRQRAAWQQQANVEPDAAAYSDRRNSPTDAGSRSE
ncbi:MAG: hypothetical protein HY043_03605 [Verrucomicrobia bacterium]|nr:hypothetical protein [Verrucomicrobiota bacterium]